MVIVFCGCVRHERSTPLRPARSDNNCRCGAARRQYRGDHHAVVGGKAERAPVRSGTFSPSGTLDDIELARRFAVESGFASGGDPEEFVRVASASGPALGDGALFRAAS